MRVKVHVPYDSLQSHVMRLHKLHQASDVLRRTSRFVILARRLQAQMSEIKDKAAEDDRSGSGEEEPSKMVEQTVEVGDQKERTIAKAALTIAELGRSLCRNACLLLTIFDEVSLLEGTLDEDFPAQTIRDEDDSSRADEDDVQDISLRSISAVAAYESFIQDARTRVTVEMERMVLSGLKSLVRGFEPYSTISHAKFSEPDSPCVITANSL